MKELKVKDLNFVNAAFKKESMNIRTKKKILLLGVPILIFALLLVVFGILQIQHLKNKMIMDNYETSITEIESNSTYQQAVKIKNQIAILEEENKNAEQLQITLNSYPQLSISFFNQLNYCITNQITIISYDYNAGDGFFTINGKANGIAETAAFVDRLRQTGLFYALDYGGYTEELIEEVAENTETDELAELQKTADETAAIAAANPDDVSAQLAAQIAAMQLSTAKQSAANDTDNAEVTTIGSGNYLFAVTGILNN